jgi:hypothetical protein
MTEKRVGTVTHYFGKPHAAVITLTGKVSVGATLRFRGHGADFEQTLGSMQVEHAAVDSAGAGAEVAVQVDEKVREGTAVYRVDA